tara:strand:- start:530 stop:700 length:171 start_codon:yes stop_codon:yes gene_type:complete
MTDNNIEKTISFYEADNGAHILVNKHALAYFKFSLDKKIKFLFYRKVFTELSKNGR